MWFPPCGRKKVAGGTDAHRLWDGVAVFLNLPQHKRQTDLARHGVRSGNWFTGTSCAFAVPPGTGCSVTVQTL